LCGGKPNPIKPVQGLLTAIVALRLYGRMVSLLGATREGAAFVALTPVVTGLMAIPVLGEWPMMIDWIAIVVISGGVYVVSGGPLPHWKGKPGSVVRSMTRSRPVFVAQFR
jgi:drug/metabolite transporter (DMT)-like permease